MVIKNFKIFERGEGIDDDDNIPVPRSYIDADNITDDDVDTNLDNYILGIPSGEVIFLNNVNDLAALVGMRLAHYTESFKGKSLKCYCTPDNNIKYILRYLDRRNIQKKDEKESDYQSVCKDFRNELREITKKTYVIAYIPDINDMKYYCAIIPDLGFNKSYYSNKIPEMKALSSIMNSKYSNSVFSFAERLTSRPDIKYYGLPY